MYSCFDGRFLAGSLVNIINNFEMALPPQGLKDKRTCRIFFSSPFGGMEYEREELTRRYFPRIQHLCSSRGIQFVAVDMRWGITSEASSSAQVINICLRELDRSDMFVGFFGQVIIQHYIGGEGGLEKAKYTNSGPFALNLVRPITCLP